MRCNCDPQQKFFFGCYCIPEDKKELNIELVEEHVTGRGIRFGFRCHGNNEDIVVLVWWKDPKTGVTEIVKPMSVSQGEIGANFCHPRSISGLKADGSMVWGFFYGTKLMKKTGLKKGRITLDIVEYKDGTQD